MWQRKLTSVMRCNTFGDITAATDVAAISRHVLPGSSVVLASCLDLFTRLGEKDAAGEVSAVSAPFRGITPGASAVFLRVQGPGGSGPLFAGSTTSWVAFDIQRAGRVNSQKTPHFDVVAECEEALGRPALTATEFRSIAATEMGPVLVQDDGTDGPSGRLTLRLRLGEATVSFNPSVSPAPANSGRATREQSTLSSCGGKRSA